MRIVCRKCVPDGISFDEWVRQTEEYIASIPEEKRADSDITEERLGICLSCENYSDGMCGECGCFIELKATKKFRSCRKWKN